MILQALVRHYENLERQGKVSREGWCAAKVSYGIALSPEGAIIGILPLKQEETRGKKTVLIPAVRMVPEMVTRSSGVSANFLCDNAKYLLGIDAAGMNPRILDCFQAAKERHLALLEGVDGEAARAVRLFFENWNPMEAASCGAVKENWEEITDGGNLVFCVGGAYAQDDPLIREAWDRKRQERNESAQGICLVTGKRTEIARIHRVIKGVLGAQSSGAALVSFNAPAFESYGKEQSYNAPVGQYAQFAYTTALNDLLSHGEDTFLAGDSMITFWAEDGEEAYQDIFSLSADPGLDNQETLRKVFDKLKKQEPVEVEGIILKPDQRFYILALAPNAARLSVRFFYEDSFGKILENLSRHYERMRIVKPVWEEREYLGIRALLYETINPKSKDKTPVPNMASMTLQAILSGSRYPASLFTDTLIRIRAEQGKITWGRAAIIKAYLIQNMGWKEGEGYMGLNEESTERAYVLGRLFAVLEGIQMDANPEIKATIRDRYFNAACAAPASVFPVLIKLKNSHMKKLERDRGGLKIYYEKQLGQIMEKLTEFPRRLSLEEQGKFDLGYYHQMQKRYEKREADK